MNFSPSQSIDVTHTDDFNEHDEEQRKCRRVFVKDGEPIVARAAGEAETQKKTEKTHQTCQKPEETTVRKQTRLNETHKHDFA